MSRPVGDFRISAADDADLQPIARLAREIWYRHYPGIISVRQIDYMLGQRYRAEAMRRQIAGGRAWWDKLETGGRLVGFASYETGERNGDMKLDKLYVDHRFQGRGFGSALLRHVETEACRHGCGRLYLQVNKNNKGAIAAYLRNGYAIVESVKVDIGNGFVMDDYVMAKEIRPEVQTPVFACA
ncbi:MAG TPA: GNAT family N-acetyltransferase [Burkholderiales bacterium]|nr:GNAT family N-acetyltransferase [Burkholderiales bacterium]